MDIENADHNAILENALTSIRLGLEDFHSNDEGRILSSVRNIYAGVLLAGKACILKNSGVTDPMEALAKNYKPVLGEDGNVKYESAGPKTIDLGELEGRFRDFGIAWPDGEIKKLQKIRNDLEHYHTKEPKESIKEAIAKSLPIIRGFFDILEIDPAKKLPNTWPMMLMIGQFFDAQKDKCEQSFAEISWASRVYSHDAYACPKCGSSLIEQIDPGNSYPSSVEAKCLACGEMLDAEGYLAVAVNVFAWNDHHRVKDGDEPAVQICPECWTETYVIDEDIHECLSCEMKYSSECARCYASITPSNPSEGYPNLCAYCYNLFQKDD